MKILINCSNLLAGGGIQVAHSFINLLKGKEGEFHIVMSDSLAQQVDETAFPSNINFYNYTIKPTVIKAFIGRDTFLDSLCKFQTIEKVFTVFGPSYWNPQMPHLVGFAKPKYIYKESPYIKNLNFKRKFKLRQKEIIDLFNFNHFSDALVTESKDVSLRLASRLKGKQVYTVTNSYNQLFDNPSDWDFSLKLPDFDGITLLTISSYYYHKNFEIIPKIIPVLKLNSPELNFRFVLTIDKKWFSDLPESISNHIVFLGKVNIAQCPFLYQQSTIMFHPSYLECFSAAYPEAMKMKVPLLVSDLGFARGICGDAAHYFDPVSAKSAGEAIFELANNTERREELITNGEKRLEMFDTPQSRAKKYLGILSQIHQIQKTNH